MSIDIKDVELLVKCGRIIWDLTKGDENKTAFIQNISEKLGIDEKKTREILSTGESLGLIKPLTTNQVRIGPFGIEYFSH